MRVSDYGSKGTYHVAYRVYFDLHCVTHQKNWAYSIWYVINFTMGYREKEMFMHNRLGVILSYVLSCSVMYCYIFSLLYVFLYILPTISCYFVDIYIYIIY